MAALLGGFFVAGDAIGQTPPVLNFKVGEMEPFQSLCTPNASGIVLSAFMEGGPELADTAFDEQAEKEECQAFAYVLWAKLISINYIGFFHDHHLWALRFGERGLSIVYYGPYESADPSPNTNGHGRSPRPVGREA